MNDYAGYHQNGVNLLIHIVAVPLFVLATLELLYALVGMQFWAAVAGVVGMMVSLILQSIGHKRESNPPVPIAGPGDFLKRIVAEQFYGFPKFVLTGRWWVNLRQP